MFNCMSGIDRRFARPWVHALASVVLLSLASVPVAAQSSTGNIAGYAKDTSGAAIPDVTVTARMVEQQTTRTGQTNSEGFYNLLALPPGKYEITFESKGFQKQTETG